MKDFFKKVAEWVKTHVWQSAVVALAAVAVIVTAIVVPIAVSNKDNGSVNNGGSRHHTHTFTNVVDERYIATPQGCENAGVYYKSCSCGEKSTETFTDGKPLGHKCSPDGTCLREGCGKYLGKEVNPVECKNILALDGSGKLYLNFVVECSKTLLIRTTGEVIDFFQIYKEGDLNTNIYSDLDISKSVTDDKVEYSSTAKLESGKKYYLEIRLTDEYKNNENVEIYIDGSMYHQFDDYGVCRECEHNFIYQITPDMYGTDFPFKTVFDGDTYKHLAFFTFQTSSGAAFKPGQLTIDTETYEKANGKFEEPPSIVLYQWNTSTGYLTWDGISAATDKGDYHEYKSIDDLAQSKTYLVILYSDEPLDENMSIRFSIPLPVLNPKGVSHGFQYCEETDELYNGKTIEWGFEFSMPDDTDAGTYYGKFKGLKAPAKLAAPYAAGYTVEYYDYHFDLISFPMSTEYPADKPVFIKVSSDDVYAAGIEHKLCCEGGNHVDESHTGFCDCCGDMLVIGYLEPIKLNNWKTHDPEGGDYISIPSEVASTSPAYVYIGLDLTEDMLVGLDKYDEDEAEELNLRYYNFDILGCKSYPHYSFTLYDITDLDHEIELDTGSGDPKLKNPITEGRRKIVFGFKLKDFESDPRIMVSLCSSDYYVEIV